MTITVVGSVAYDAVRTPSGVRKRMLGGAATHFALAASFFDEVRVVATVGADFTDSDMEVLATRGTAVDDVERIPDGRTFFWKGEYGDDLNDRRTIDTQLNVFEHFQPRLSAQARACDVLFLANIQPDLQAGVLDQCDGPDLVALDSMNLWIDVARDTLVAVVERVDCLILNDAELRQLTGRSTLIAAAREVISWGPTVVVGKQGEYGATLITADDVFALPAFPLEEVADPTGAGDTFAGGFVGRLARFGGAANALSRDRLADALAYGTAIASYNVEEFGTERVARLTKPEIAARVAQLSRMTTFVPDVLSLENA